MSESPLFQPIAVHGVEAEVVRERRMVIGVPTGFLSRGIAAIEGTTHMVRLPGSRGGAGRGIASLPPVHVHAFDRIRGGDHRRE